MSNYYNNFKETKIRGTLQVSDHPTDNTKLANAIFDRDITVSNIIHNTDLDNKFNECIKTGDFPPNTTSDLSGVKFCWNNNTGYGHTLITNFQQLGGYKAFEFWNVSSNIVPTLLLSILNNGFVLLNGVNNTSSQCIEYIKNLSSDCQSQINTLSNNFSNYVLSSSLATTLNDYTTLSYINSQNFLTSASLSGYVLSSTLSTTLSDYVTTSYLTSQNYLTSASLSGYVLSSTLSTTLSDYVTTSYLTSQNYLTSASLSGYVLSSSLTNYVLLSTLSTTLSDYVTTSYLTSQNYLTSASLSGYVLSSSLSTTINNSLSDFTTNVLTPYYASIYGVNNWTNELNSFVSFTFSNKINNVWASTFDYIKNLSSDCQNQLNNLQSQINTILSYNYIQFITFPSLTYQNGQGLKIAWNKSNGLGETNIINFQDGGQQTAFTFWNTSPSIIPTLVLTIKNTGELICNSLTISSGLATLYNIVGYSANITNIKCDTIVVEKSIMNSANKVFVGSGVPVTWLMIDIDLINYSTYSKNFAISTIVHTGNRGRFVFNEAPTDLNIGQIIYLFHPNLDYGDLFVDGNNFNNGTNQKFLYNGYTGQLTSQILITQGTSCQLIYMGDNTWLGIMTYTPSTTPTDSNYVSGSINSTTYLNISIPSFPSNPF